MNKDFIKSKVIEILLDKYITVDEESNSLHTAILPGNMKKNKIYVGDNVIIKKSYDTYLITEIIKRKNFVMRPPVSNISQMILLISIDNPKPDYILLDKQIVLCKVKNIIPIICINKIDLLNDKLDLELEYIKKIYSNLNIELLQISSKNEIGLDNLKDKLKNNTSAFSGNSGVGKSSVIIKLLNNSSLKIEIGEIGSKTNKGKHTTKYVKLYNIDKNSFILDTPGFSSYELYDIESEDLKKYYDEFSKYECNYLDCNHINEGIAECKIKQAVNNNEIDIQRYERYKYIYASLKTKEDVKYK
ncbi:MAG: ribosome small subunit-dependent GTPase A [Clostridia bacterium]|nr:ribosome small subunit-dependent GTPase A [Clostridia bacterium]MDD4386755.1 ribosome small subunit-dependent GTPase A [Clostridia bacterium]